MGPALGHLASLTKTRRPMYGNECVCVRERERVQMDVAHLVTLPNGETRWSWVQPLHSIVT